MINEYYKILNNELTSNFSLFEAKSNFAISMVLKSDSNFKIDYAEIYQKMFYSNKNSERTSKIALDAIYGNPSESMISVMNKLIKGDLGPLKERDVDANTLLRILLELIDSVTVSDTKEVLSSVRDTDLEFSSLKKVIQLLTGIFSKEDSDRFDVISKIYKYFKSKGISVFKKLIEKYDSLLDGSNDELTYESANKKNKKLVAELISIFNENESNYAEVISELSSIKSSKFAGIGAIDDALSNRISDDAIEEYRDVITFCFKHLNELLELRNHDIEELASKYEAIVDKKIEKLIESTKTRFGNDSIKWEKLYRLNVYMLAVHCNGRLEDIIDYLKKHEISSYQVFMVLNDTERQVLKNPSLGFLIEALEGDLDDALDNFGAPASLSVLAYDDESDVRIYGSTDKDDKSAKITYLSILACLNGFDAKKLPFVQKFAR
jgi:uncharacterized protein YdiU (UPF0061 family)